MQEKSNGKNAKFPAARIVDGVVKSIIVEKVIHTKFMAYRDQSCISQVHTIKLNVSCTSDVVWHTVV